MAYATHPVIRSYMDDVTPNCKEDKVDNMWLNIAQFYFPLRDNFGCEREARIVSLVRNGRKAKVLFIENKRPSKAKGGPKRSSWERAKSQLLNYMLRERHVQPDLTGDLRSMGNGLRGVQDRVFCAT
ncbi:hypothetical protein N7516_001638 [Penicillium verrucosum]|uniref:uncharacterized protein n=1 Tax=Penicillium verrucosum TaxID=60171 RepID=UPI0025456518|nr:uncharacterized protein N7516_001638 [Penicillium verrucosum]KAJ5941470.1 hypothetical protein N7516_001638 [Penicillium verrucosum]